MLGWRGAGGGGREGYGWLYYRRAWALFFFFHSLQAATEEACGLVLRPLQRCVRGLYAVMGEGKGEGSFERLQDRDVFYWRGSPLSVSLSSDHRHRHRHRRFTPCLLRGQMPLLSYRG